MGRGLRDRNRLLNTAVLHTIYVRLITQRATAIEQPGSVDSDDPLLLSRREPKNQPTRRTILPLLQAPPSVPRSAAPRNTLGVYHAPRLPRPRKDSPAKPRSRPLFNTFQERFWVLCKADSFFRVGSCVTSKAKAGHGSAAEAHPDSEAWPRCPAWRLPVFASAEKP